MKVTSGNRGDAVRSDCYTELCDGDGTADRVVIKSKVKALYGRSMETLCHDMLGFYGLKGVNLFIEDSGALPFVLAARLECAVKQRISTKKNFLFDQIPENDYSISSGRYRRSRLYIPGNHPKMMINAGIYGSDAVILDLEDSVLPGKKQEARFLVRNALCQVNFYGAERMVRINQVPEGLNDLEFIVPYGVHTILVPKCESSDDILFVEQRIRQIQGVRDAVHLIPIIETALGVENALEIALSSDHVVALAIGLEDYITDIGAQRTEEGHESFYARSRIVNAARAAGIQPLDSVVPHFGDPEALAVTARSSRAIGFTGMGCIHPAQIQPVNQGYSPSGPELDQAKRIVYAFHQAEQNGQGVVAVDSKMVDAPVVERALRTIENAIDFGMLNHKWMESYGNEPD